MLKKETFFMLLIFFCSAKLAGQDFITHEVKEGETLWRISKNYNISFDELLKINNIDDATKIKAGFILKIPGNSNVAPDKDKETKTENTGKFRFHFLKKDETLWSLSKKYNVSVEEICKLNNISDFSKIKKNARLKIPEKIEFIEYPLPVKEGKIQESNTVHFKGIYIFSGNDNESVHCVDNGVVSFIDSISGYGITIFIRHDNGYVSSYAGFKELYVKNGDEIKKDQVIGKVGNISRYDKFGILFSIQYKGTALEYNKEEEKFIKPAI